MVTTPTWPASGTSASPTTPARRHGALSAATRFSAAAPATSPTPGRSALKMRSRPCTARTTGSSPTSRPRISTPPGPTSTSSSSTSANRTTTSRSWAISLLPAPNDALWVPDDWLDRCRGRYDAGYDAIRGSRLERMKEIELIACDVEANPGRHSVKLALGQRDLPHRRLCHTNWTGVG